METILENEPIKVRARFANESTFTTIYLKKGVFKPQLEIQDVMFGWIDNLYVSIPLEDWNMVSDIWNNENK